MKIGPNERKLWTVFSEFVRRRDADKHTGVGYCCTCRKPLHWQDGDAGHFIGRRHKSLKFDERNVHLQCRACNRFNAGNQFAHGLHIDRHHGSGTAEMLHNMHRLPSRMGEYEYGLLLTEYKAKLKRIQECEK